MFWFWNGDIVHSSVYNFHIYILFESLMTYGRLQNKMAEQATAIWLTWEQTQLWHTLVCLLQNVTCNSTRCCLHDDIQLSLLCNRTPAVLVAGVEYTCTKRGPSPNNYSKFCNKYCNWMTSLYLASFKTRCGTWLVPIDVFGCCITTTSSHWQ